MKIVLILFIFVLCSFISKSQNFASVTNKQPAPAFSFSSNLLLNDSTQRDKHRMNPHSTNYNSTINKVGSWILVGGMIVGVAGIIEYKNATVNYGPFSVVDQTKQDDGTLLEVVGGISIVTGLTMIIIGYTEHDSKKEKKISICSPKPNELGLALRL